MCVDGDEEQYVAGTSAQLSTEVADNNQVLQLTIHRTDKLKSHVYIAHPVVRVHIVNLDTGNCLKKQKKFVIVVFPEMPFCYLGDVNRELPLLLVLTLT